MKKNVLLIGSVAANAVLLAVVAVQIATRPVAPEPAGAGANPTAKRPTNKRPSTTSSSSDAIHWNDNWTGSAASSGGGLSRTQTDRGSDAPPVVELPAGFNDLVQRLRSMGVAEETLANLVQSELSRQWQDRNRNIQRQIRRGELEPEARQQLGQFWQQDQENAMRAALGDEAYERWAKNNLLRHVDIEELGLGETEVDSIYDVQRDNQKRMQELSRKHQAGEIDQHEYQQEQAALQKEMEKQMSSAIGADRYGKYKQGGDWSYNNLRTELRGTSVTEAQVDALYRSMKQYEQKRVELNQQSQSGKSVAGNVWQDIQTQQEQESLRILGAQGYADYKKSQDYRYKQLKQYAPAWKLSAGDIDHVYRTVTDHQKSVQDYQKEAESVRSKGENVDWNQVQQSIKEFTGQTDAELRRYLGEERYQKLKRAGIIQLNQ